MHLAACMYAFFSASQIPINSAQGLFPISLSFTAAGNFHHHCSEQMRVRAKQCENPNKNILLADTVFLNPRCEGKASSVSLRFLTLR